MNLHAAATWVCRAYRCALSAIQMTLQHEFILFLASVQRPITEKSGPQQSREFRVDFRWAWHEGACSCAVGLELLRVPYPHSHGQVGVHARSQLRPQLQVQVQRQSIAAQTVAP